VSEEESADPDLVDALAARQPKSLPSVPSRQVPWLGARA